MKTLLLSFLLSLFASAALAHSNPSLCAQHYPHWRCSDPKQLKLLKKINHFVVEHAHQGFIAAFDWDGTLYNERIAMKSGPLKGMRFSGQAAWIAWSASQLKQHPNWFPLWQTHSPDNGIALINQDLYTEGHTSAKLNDYSKFVQIAQYPAGMAPATLGKSIQAFLKQYPAKDYAFLPMFDVLQRMHQLGYQLWIITGSNPYFVANVLKHIEDTVPYKGNQPYSFGILSKNINGTYPGRIAGNATRLNQQGLFTLVYNNQFVQSPTLHNTPLARYVVDQAGKALAMQNFIQPRSHAPVILYAGNSGGDYQAANYLLHQPGRHLLIAVKERNENLGTLDDMVNAHPHQSVVVPMHSIVN